MPVLDNSQYSAWWKCPTYWFTVYIAGVQKAWEGQRNDPLCIGSLFHNGMENWYGNKKIKLDQDVLDDNTPDKESYDLVMNLLTNYVTKYPYEPWEIESIEQAYRIPLISDWEAVAKVDKVAIVSKPTEIESGIDGQPIIVPPGRYALEHKTKSGWGSRAMYINGWRRRKQVDFQQLCAGVNGVIINIAEKPAVRQPTRKCQGCKNTFEFRAWLPIKDRRYQCSSCGHEQELKPVEIKQKDPEFFRIFQARRPDQLEASLEEFKDVATQMDDIINGLATPKVNPLSCIDERWNRQCDYLLDCEAFTDPLQRPGFVKISDPLHYIGLEN